MDERLVMRVPKFSGYEYYPLSNKEQCERLANSLREDMTNTKFLVSRIKDLPIELLSYEEIIRMRGDLSDISNKVTYNLRDENGIDRVKLMEVLNDYSKLLVQYNELRDLINVPIDEDEVE